MNRQNKTRICCSMTLQMRPLYKLRCTGDCAAIKEGRNQGTRQTQNFPLKECLGSDQPLQPHQLVHLRGKDGSDSLPPLV